MIDDGTKGDQAQALIPFTGFYALDGWPSGAFVMVDTNSVWIAGSGGSSATTEYAATITLCEDGLTSAKYPLGDGCTFENDQLTITDLDGTVIADLTFSDGSGISSIEGTVGGNAATGGSPFKPIELSVWTGTYYRQTGTEQEGGLLRYLYEPALQINADGTVAFAAPKQPLQAVPSYWYDYGMFVVGVMSAPGSPAQLLEMGTSSGWGRVGGDAENGSMLVGIRRNELVPKL